MLIIRSRWSGPIKSANNYKSTKSLSDCRDQKWTKLGWSGPLWYMYNSIYQYWLLDFAAARHILHINLGLKAWIIIEDLVDTIKVWSGGGVHT